MYSRMVSVKTAGVIVLVLSFWIVALPAAAAEEGLVAHWDFNEGQGDVLHDRSGNGNDGKIHGAKWVKVGDGYALKFGYEKSFVDLGTEHNIPVTGDMTLTVWVKLMAAPNKRTNYCIVDCETYKKSGFLVRVNGDSSKIFYRANQEGGLGSINCKYINRTLKNFAFHHIAVTRTGTSVTVYLDGTLDSVFKIEQPLPPARGLNISSRGQSFNGLLDDLKFYNRVLSAEEIQAEYQKGAKSHADQSYAQAPQEQGLVAHWDFDEGQGNVLQDKSGNGNDGKIHGAEWVKTGNGYALKFDGVDDYVDCGNGPSLDITGPISLEAWVYLESAPKKNEAGIVGKFYTSYTLNYSTNGRCYWYRTSGGHFCRTLPLETGSWHHLVGTMGIFHGATPKTSFMKLYVDGKLVGKREYKLKTVNKGKNFLMGCMVHDPATQNPGLRSISHFHGMIDEVRVYNRALSEMEIARNYNQHAKEKGHTLKDTSASKAAPQGHIRKQGGSGRRTRRLLGFQRGSGKCTPRQEREWKRRQNPRGAVGQSPGRPCPQVRRRGRLCRLRERCEFGYYRPDHR